MVFHRGNERRHWTSHGEPDRNSRLNFALEQGGSKQKADKSLDCQRLDRSGSFCREIKYLAFEDVPQTEN